jgi:hypothetical protein
MKIKVLTHVHGFLEVEIPDDFMFLRITYMTGDEIIEIYREDPMWGDAYLYKTIDKGLEDRSRNFLDATYIVYPDQIEVWNERVNRYHIWQEEKFMKTFKGYIGFK